MNIDVFVTYKTHPVTVGVKYVQHKKLLLNQDVNRFLKQDLPLVETTGTAGLTLPPGFTGQTRKRKLKYLNIHSRGLFLLLFFVYFNFSSCLCLQSPKLDHGSWRLL